MSVRIVFDAIAGFSFPLIRPCADAAIGERNPPNIPLDPFFAILGIYTRSPFFCGEDTTVGLDTLLRAVALSMPRLYMSVFRPTRPWPEEAIGERTPPIIAAPPLLVFIDINLLLFVCMGRNCTCDTIHLSYSLGRDLYY